MRGAIVVLVALLTVSCGGGPARAPAHPAERVLAVVTRVVDGDTVHVRLGERDVAVRLIGIDTPEKDGPYTRQECFGLEATDYTTQRLEGRQVSLEFDVERTDRYDRTLAYVWLGDELFDEQVVREGFARVATFPPNVRYVDRFTAAERDAQAANRGLWGSCPAG